MLFNCELELMPTSFGLIKVSPSIAADCYCYWQNKILEAHGMHVSVVKRNADPNRALEGLLPLTSPIRTRFAFLPTKSRWTMFADNGVQGTDAAAVMSVMSKKLNCESMRVVCIKENLFKDSDKQAKNQYGAVIFEVYSVDGNPERTIYAANDGGKWKFGQSGTAYSFEDQDAYNCRIVKDRFTANMLIDYLKHFGAEPFNKNWFTNGAIVMEKKGALPDNIIEYV